MTEEYSRQESDSEQDARRCVLVSVLEGEQMRERCERALAELRRLCDTAGLTVCAELTQQLRTPLASTYIGHGKLAELGELCRTQEASVVVFDCELSPVQIKNIEDGIEREVRIVDRTMLILDIFAQNALTGEGMLQVEIAQLRYNVPRLTGKGKALSRLGGGIGTRGPGESKLETDRRHVRRKIGALQKKLVTLSASRDLRRRSRSREGKPQVTIAGYTNAGKSTLLNYLTDAGILAQDKLFATLDPTTRALQVPDYGEVLLTDTVGFIDRLPHHLVEAFASTLDEVAYADLLLLVLDASDPEVSHHLAVAQSILSDLYEKRKVLPPRTVFVYNKCDLVAREQIACGTDSDSSVYLSAHTGEGMDSLLSLIARCLSESRRRVRFVLPVGGGEWLSLLYRQAQVLEVEYQEDGVEVIALADESVRGKLSAFEK